MKVYLFDFDGTLVDSMPTFVSVMEQVMTEFGVPYDQETLRTIVPLGYRGTVEYYEKQGLQLPIENMTRRMGELMVGAYRDWIPAKDAVIPTIQALHARGVRLAILTASPHIMLDPALMRLGIFDLFERVWSCEDFETTKSDPAIYHRAAEALGVDVSEVLFFDDNVNALATAQRAGMSVCGVYDPSSAEEETEIRSFADRYIHSFSELSETADEKRGEEETE